MAELRRTITYEVQALRGSRWEIHARFDEHGRHVALTRARAMNRHPRVLAVQVLKEIYDPDKGAQEFVIYKSRSIGPKTPPRPKAKPSRRERLRRRIRSILSSRPPMAALFSRFVKIIAPSPIWIAIPRAFLGTLVAFLAAILVTGMTAYMLGGSSTHSVTTQTDIVILLIVFSSIFLFGAFIVGFLLTAGSAPRYGSRTTLARKRPRRPSFHPVAPKGRAPSSLSKPSPTARHTRKVETLRDQVVNYMRQAIRPTRGAYDLKDSYIRFGINLFVAGASETLCQQHAINISTTSVIMAAGLRAIGVKSDHAASLAENYVEYLISDARYMAMFGRGRDAIMAHLAGKANSTDLLLQALDEWTQSHALQVARTQVTVMFTRMNGFDEFVASRGDEPTRQAVQAHNLIVDRRLAEFNGKRIKHVHNGTMAAFMVSADALRAADAIRSDFVEQSRHASDDGLTLSIGLNCGEPIAEGNDLFGTSVQMAIRIVEAAKPGQILVSGAIRNHLLTEAPTMTFAVCGPLALKGFSDPIPLYELTGI